MRSLRIPVLIVVAIFSVVLIAVAQQSGQSKPGGMQMGDMMKGCQEHCQATSGAIDKTLATVREARKSNDPARMRAALEQAEKPLAKMKEHMSMCMSMMNMMQKMHGPPKGGN